MVVQVQDVGACLSSHVMVFRHISQQAQSRDTATKASFPLLLHGCCVLCSFPLTLLAFSVLQRDFRRRHVCRTRGTHRLRGRERRYPQRRSRGTRHERRSEGGGRRWGGWGGEARLLWHPLDWIQVSTLRAAAKFLGAYVAFACRDFLLKPELLRSISDLGFEHPSEGEWPIVPGRVQANGPCSSAGMYPSSCPRYGCSVPGQVWSRKDRSLRPRHAPAAGACRWRSSRHCALSHA